MNFRFTFPAPVRLGVLALGGLWVAVASAQTAPAALAGPVPASALVYRSAFEGYKPYSDDKVGDWRGANDSTGRIWGWRAYAKEASQPGPTPPAPNMPARPDPQAQKEKTRP